MADAVRFIKISKKDKNGIDKTPTLQSLSEITIPYSTGNVRYDILNIIEKPTYFLYEVNNPNLEWADRAEVGYDFTGSANTDEIPVSGSKIVDDLTITPISDPLFFSSPSSINSSLNIVKLKTYPQKDLLLSITGSLIIDNVGGGGSYNGVYDPRVYITEHQQDGGISELVEVDLVNTGPGSTTTHNFNISYTIPNSSPPGTEFGFRIISQKAGSDLISGSYQFSTTQAFITSSTATGLALETIPEPYFFEDFSRALDCQPLLNNAVNNRLSSFHQDIDYSSGMLTPTNFELLISGSALKASIQGSNYTLKRHTNPRYDGSRTTSQKLNEWTEGDTNTFGKLPTTLTQDRVIYEFEFGGGTTPELLGWGGLKMSNLYLVNTPDSVRTIQSGVDSTTRVVRSTLHDGFAPFPEANNYRKPAYVSQSFDEYYYTINKNNPTNHEITLFQYDSNQSNTAPSTTRVLTTDFSVPGVSNYAATSSNAQYGAITSGSNILKISSSINISNVGISGGAYSIIGSLSLDYAITKNIWANSQQRNDDRWFITLYNDLTFPINNNDLEPYNVGFTASIDNVLVDPLASKGVFEILGLKKGNISDQPSEFVMSHTFTEDRDIGNSDLGFLMWKAEKTGKHVLVQSSVSGVGAGAFTSRFTPEEITQNLTSITKEYGINKT